MSPKERQVEEIRDLLGCPDGAKRHLNCMDLAHLIGLKTGEPTKWRDIDAGRMRREVVDLYDIDTKLDFYTSGNHMGFYEYRQILDVLKDESQG